MALERSADLRRRREQGRLIDYVGAVRSKILFKYFSNGLKPEKELGEKAGRASSNDGRKASTLLVQLRYSCGAEQQGEDSVGIGRAQPPSTKFSSKRMRECARACSRVGSCSHVGCCVGLGHASGEAGSGSDAPCGQMAGPGRVARGLGRQVIGFFLSKRLR